MNRFQSVNGEAQGPYCRYDPHLGRERGERMMAILEAQTDSFRRGHTELATEFRALRVDLVRVHERQMSRLIDRANGVPLKTHIWSILAVIAATEGWEFVMHLMGMK